MLSTEEKKLFETFLMALQKNRVNSTTSYDALYSKYQEFITRKGIDFDDLMERAALFLKHSGESGTKKWDLKDFDKTGFDIFLKYGDDYLVRIIKAGGKSVVEKYSDKGVHANLEGGKADEVKTGFDLDQLCKGLRVEMEHTDEPLMALEIAMDHLVEIPDYYDHLERMEKEALGKSVDPSLRPPKKWFNHMLKEIKSRGYSEESASAIIGNLWYKKLTEERRAEIRKREGKKYGPAQS